jgi:hypothetical protein
MLSRWVKCRPWYYTERRQPTRAAEFRRVLIEDDPPRPLIFDERDLAIIAMHEDYDPDPLGLDPDLKRERWANED